MPMTKTAAKIFVAKIGGLATDSSSLTLAEDAINATYQKWNTLNHWMWTLKDNTSSFSIATCVIAGNGTTVTCATTTYPLDAVNVGVVVTGSSLTAPTVFSITRDTSGHVASFELSAAATPGTMTLTFAGYIPVTSGTNEYNLPIDYNRPHDVRLLTNKRLLEYWPYHLWNRRITDQTATGVPCVYTLFNPVSQGTQGFTRMRLFYTPSIADIMLMQYFRKLDQNATNLDVIDDYLYVFLDDARCTFLMERNSEDPRLPTLITKVEKALSRILAHDEEQVDNEESRLISQAEAPMGTRINFDVFGGW